MKKAHVFPHHFLPIITKNVFTKKGHLTRGFNMLAVKIDFLIFFTVFYGST
jgi:hypothetical protein